MGDASSAVSPEVGTEVCSDDSSDAGTPGDSIVRAARFSRGTIRFNDVNFSSLPGLAICSKIPSLQNDLTTPRIVSESIARSSISRGPQTVLLSDKQGKCKTLRFPHSSPINIAEAPGTTSPCFPGAIRRLPLGLRW